MKGRFLRFALKAKLCEPRIFALRLIGPMSR